MAIDPKRVKEIFLEAANVSDEAARAALLDRACGGDAELRARVEALLRSHDPQGSFLGAPAAVVPAPDPGRLGYNRLRHRILFRHRLDIRCFSGSDILATKG